MKTLRACSCRCSRSFFGQARKPEGEYEHADEDDSDWSIMDFHAIATIARQELVVNVRNKWILTFAVAFAVLVLAISYFGLVTAGTVGFQSFRRTSASLLSLVLYVVPLIS